jgi:hypothetical protein
MATFTWKAGTTGLWRTLSDWTPAGGPPGASSVATDIAVVGATNSAYTVTIDAGHTFDILTLDLSGGSSSHTTTLSIFGGLFTNSLDYLSSSGPNAAIIDIGNGCL